MAVEQTIPVGESRIRLRASALTPRLYRCRFGRDLMEDMRLLRDAAGRIGDDARSGFSLEELTVFENVAYVMAKHADDTLPDTPEEWLDSMDSVFTIYRILPVILRMWNLNCQTTSVPKKK